MMPLPQTFKILVNGETGSGKTFFSCTFPLVAYFGTEPNGLDTARAHPQLGKNIVSAEEFLPSPSEDVKAVFERLEKSLKVAHEQAKQGKVQTLVLDNLTFLAQNRWLYINQYEKQYGRSGEVDTRGMYGALGTWLYRFTLIYLCSFPGNVVVTCHEQREDEEALADRVDPTLPIVPNILGSFRNKVGGLFSANLFLGVKKDSRNGTYHYYARCLKGDQRGAKNRYGLGEIIEDVSFQKLVDSLPKHENDKLVAALPKLENAQA